MSVKYHISSTTQRPNICRAKSPESCPLKSYDGTPPPHFESKEEARAYVEKRNEEKYGDVPETSSSKNSGSSEMSESGSLNKIKIRGAGVRAGDILVVQKTENGKQINEEKKVVTVYKELGGSGKSKVEVTYENGETDVLNGKLPIRVKRSSFDGEGYRLTAEEADRSSLSLYRRMKKGYIPDEKEVDAFISDMRRSDPSLRAGMYSRRIGSMLGDNGRNHEATLLKAQYARSIMDNDLNYKLSNHDAHNVIYSSEFDGTSLEEKRALREKYPAATSEADYNLSKTAKDLKKT